MFYKHSQSAGLEVKQFDRRNWEGVIFMTRMFRKNVLKTGCRQKSTPKGDGRAKKCGDRVAT